MRVLVVDDNIDTTDMLDIFFKHNGVDVVSVNDAKSCLQLVRSEQFDAILLDLAMPEVSGFDVIDIMHKENLMAKSRVIVYTASSPSPHIQNQMKDLGVHEILNKPLDLSLLLQIIRGKNA